MWNEREENRNKYVLSKWNSRHAIADAISTCSVHDSKPSEKKDIRAFWHYWKDCSVRDGDLNSISMWWHDSKTKTTLVLLGTWKAETKNFIICNNGNMKCLWEPNSLHGITDQSLTNVTPDPLVYRGPTSISTTCIKWYFRIAAKFNIYAG